MDFLTQLTPPGQFDNQIKQVLRNASPPSTSCLRFVFADRPRSPFAVLRVTQKMPLVFVIFFKTPELRAQPSLFACSKVLPPPFLRDVRRVHYFTSGRITAPPLCPPQDMSAPRGGNSFPLSLCSPLKGVHFPLFYGPHSDIYGRHPLDLA